MLVFIKNYFLFLFLLVFCLFGVLKAEDDGLTEEEEERTASLQIKTQTKLYSADYYRAGGEGGGEQDRKRKDIGVGEEISLLLVGKPKGKIPELEWTVSGDGLEVKQGDLKGKQLITLIAKKDLAKDTAVTISAKTSEGKTASETINIKVPGKITGKKTTEKFEGSDGETIDPEYYSLNKGRFGVFGFIEVTLSPTNVSFKNINVIERDKGLEWEGKGNTPPVSRPVLASSHTGSGAGKRIEIKDKNSFHDFVSELTPLDEVLAAAASDRNPQVFWWLCDFHVLQNDSVLIGKATQKFTLTAVSQTVGKAKVEKFGVTFERSSDESK